MTRRYVFTGCVVDVDDDAQLVITRFADYRSVTAAVTDESHASAHRLGYDDVWTMTVDHEVGHSWLAYTHGLAWSPTMWRLAHPDTPGAASDSDVACEETQVLAWQRSELAHSTAPRPWEARRAQ